jgi:hypothetical protein
VVRSEPQSRQWVMAKVGRETAKIAGDRATVNL